MSTEEGNNLIATFMGEGSTAEIYAGELAIVLNPITDGEAPLCSTIK